MAKLLLVELWEERSCFSDIKCIWHHLAPCASLKMARRSQLPQRKSQLSGRLAHSSFTLCPLAPGDSEENANALGTFSWLCGREMVWSYCTCYWFVFACVCFSMVLLKLRNRVRMAENGVKLNMKAAPFIQRLIGKGQSSVSSNECFDLFLSQQQRTNLSCACQYMLLESTAHQPLLPNPYPP